MDFSFSVNNLLGDTITKLDSNVTPARRNAEGYSQNELRGQLMSVIDKMGDASAKAQGLYSTITTGRKLSLSDHSLYVMKDASGNGGRGSAVGILKIGPKKLFVYSHHGNVHEMEPLCVLDFYVHESRQRMGCGRKLFDFMLQHTGVKAAHLAIDRPSYKFSQFLKKHYNLKAEVPQVNNFVVFEGFFSNRPDSAPKRRSGYGRPPQVPNKRREHMIEDGFMSQNSQNGYSQNGYGQQNGYGRPPLPPTNQNTGQGLIGQMNGYNSRPGSGSSLKARSASVLSTPRQEMTDLVRPGQLRPISATQANDAEQRAESRLRAESRNITAQELISKGNQMYSRHINRQESPIGSLPGSRPPSGNSASKLTGGMNLGSNNIAVGNQYSNNNNYLPSKPPVLRRGVTTDGYNLHQDYQGRQGRLKVNDRIEQTIRNPFLSRKEDNAVGSGWEPPENKSNWTVFKNEPSYLSLAARNYTHTRLW